MSGKKKIIVIVGPTASGKTRLAIKLAKRIKGEIISADSMQAYKGMVLISQAPSKRELRSARHHLIGFLDPGKEYSAALFSKLARRAICDIIKRKKIPIIAGGSGLYIRALVDGLFPSKGKDIRFRSKMEKEAREKGVHCLHKKLRARDPDAALKIHPNDTKRIIRALEICKLEKSTKTELKKSTKGIKEKYIVYLFGLNMARCKLYERINSRVDDMFKEDIIREVKALLKKKLSTASRQALGIRQVEGFLKGEYDKGKAEELLKRDTRRFAKRQLTWFRPNHMIKWLDLDKFSEQTILETIQGDV